MARTCPSCAFEVRRRADACPRCGTGLEAGDPDASGAGAGPTPGEAAGGDRAGHDVGRGSGPADAEATAGMPQRPDDPPLADPPTTTTRDDSSFGSNVRNWAMAAHLAAYSVFLVPIPVIGPVIVWALKREDHPFIDHHGKEAVNFNLSVFIYGVIAAVSLILLVGFVLLPLVFLFWFIVTIVAALKAASGEWYRCPLTIRFLN